MVFAGKGWDFWGFGDFFEWRGVWRYKRLAVTHSLQTSARKYLKFDKISKKMKRVFDKPFRKLISIYTLIFILLFTVCSSLNWLLTIYSKSIEVDSFAVFGIPIALSSLVTFLLFRKLVSRLNFDEKITSFTLWFLLPFPMAFSIAMSQKYFYDISYPVITIENPTEIQQYPDGRFFHIKNYFVVKDHFFCFTHIFL